MANEEVSPLRHIHLSYDPKDSDTSCLRLLYELSPDWKTVERDDVKLHQFTDGITNTLIKASRVRSEQSDTDSSEGTVLIRAYGSGTSTMIDREKELRVHALLASKGLASPLLAGFDNGFMHGFIPGIPCEAQDFHDAQTSREIAKRLGEWHGRLPISTLATPPSTSIEDVPTIWTNANKWIGLLPSHTAELQARNDGFKSELAWLSDQFSSLPGLRGRDLVFSHTDLLCANVIIEELPKESEQIRPVTIIDYEYATAAPAVFDVANVFAEWAGADRELAWMPSRGQRLMFIRSYVSSFRRHAELRDGEVGTAEGEDVEQLYEQVETCRGLPGFYWNLWALIQASISDIDFDYVAYADSRHSEYLGWKAEFDGSRERDGKQPTAREKAWAKE